MTGIPNIGRLGAMIDRSGVPQRIKSLLPRGGRPRQLSVRTLLLGMLIAQEAGHPAHLTRVHRALMALDTPDQVVLGVRVEWRTGPHLVTYRQVERTFSLVVAALSKDAPDGEPSEMLDSVADAWMEASVPTPWSQPEGSLAVDWSDLSAFATPPPKKGGTSADPEASWGRRKSIQPGMKDELFFGYHLQAATTPDALLQLVPLARSATGDDITAHDQMSAEASRYKLGRVSSDDEDGYHRVACPAVMGKVRCPLREASLRLSSDRPEVLTPPASQPRCCQQQTVTVGPDVLAKTAQKHDYPSQSHRSSYARRTAVERTFSTTKDRATNDMTRGWCRLTGVTAITLFAVATFVVRNHRIIDAFEARQVEDRRRLQAGLPPKTRRRRRKTIGILTGAASASSP